MPGIEDWVNCPLDIVQGLFDANESGETHSSKVVEYFKSKLEDSSALSWVPSINDTPLHNLQGHTLVKFRCMVQDMYDPEFYLGVFEVKDVKTGQTHQRSGKYRDIAQCLPHQEIQLNSSKNKTMDRQTLYCVPVPGEHQWCKLVHSQNESKVTPSTSQVPVRCKRGLDEESVPDVSEENNTNADSMDTESTDSSTANKKSKPAAQQGPSASKTPDLNFPLPDEKGPACMVKLYEGGDTFKLNDVVEFIGVLSNDPLLANFPDGEKESSSFLDEGGELMDAEEEAHTPPPSLVPRLHAILAHKLSHVNPLLPSNLSTEEGKTAVQTVLSEAKNLRTELLSIFEHALFGDKLAAEYLLCNLLSSVYSRKDVIALGKFTLNLSGCPVGYPSLLCDLLQELVTKSYMLPMTLANMNQLKFVPAKDYTANRLTSGVLQLSEQTHLFVDETQLQQGQLDTNGVKNLTALGNVISWQKLDYDFNFHRQEFSTNIILTLLSEGKSLLPSDCHVKLVPTVPVSNITERFEAARTYLTPALLSKLRAYITVMQNTDYTLSEDMQKLLQEDFVDARKEDSKNMTVEDFHSLLVLTRFLSLSMGQSTLTRDIWQHAKVLEVQRKARLPTSS